MRTPSFWYPANRRWAGGLPWLLMPVSVAVQLAARIRQLLVRPYHAPVPVICVGNLTVGGAGKTPAVLALVALLAARGIQVHCLSRGYGGRLPGPLRVDPARHTAAQVGDEPLLLARVAPAWISRNRKRGAMAAVAAGAGLLLLDDGHQNPSIAKDVSLLLVDPARCLGNGWTLPSGPLRESLPHALSRANAVLLTGSGDCVAVRQAAQQRGIPVLRAGKQAIDGEMLSEKRLFAFSGIAVPEQFFDMLVSFGVNLVGSKRFSDHHPYTDAELTAMFTKAGLADAELITTEKDFVRLPPRVREHVLTLGINMQFTDQDALMKVLAPALSRLKAGGA